MSLFAFGLLKVSIFMENLSYSAVFIVNSPLPPYSSWRFTILSVSTTTVIIFLYFSLRNLTIFGQKEKEENSWKSISLKTSYCVLNKTVLASFILLCCNQGSHSPSPLFLQVFNISQRYERTKNLPQTQVAEKMYHFGHYFLSNCLPTAS